MFLALKIESLTKKLDNPDPYKRLLAVESLVQLNHPATELALVKALSCWERDVRTLAVKGLGALYSKSTVEPLIGALNDLDGNVRVAAIESLSKLNDPRAIVPLVNSLGDFSVVRLKAASALLDLGEAKWKEIIKGDAEDMLRLGKSGDARAIEPLLQMLKGTSYDEVDRVSAARALAILKEPKAVIPLITVLCEKNYAGVIDISEKIQAAAATALGAIHAFCAVEPLVQALSDSSVLVQLAAVQALGEMKCASAVDGLIQALFDGSSKLRVKTAEALEVLGEEKWQKCVHGDDQDFLLLGATGDPRVLEPLIKALCNNSQGVRIAAATALKTWKDDRAVEPLIKALNDTCAEVGIAATQALEEMKDLRAVQPLIDILASHYAKPYDRFNKEHVADKYKDVRAEAASALGNLGDQRAISVLMKALNDQCLYVRANALVALTALTAPHTVQMLISEVKNGNEGASRALSRFKDPSAVEPLIQELTSEKSSVVHAAAVALGMLDDPRAVEPLIKALHFKDGFVRRAIIEALGMLKDLRATYHVSDMLHDTDYRVQITAANVLGSLKDPRAVEPLARTLGNYRDDLQIAAAQALSEIHDVSAWGPLLQALG